MVINGDSTQTSLTRIPSPFRNLQTTGLETLPQRLPASIPCSTVKQAIFTHRAWAFNWELPFPLTTMLLRRHLEMHAFNPHLLHSQTFNTLDSLHPSQTYAPPAFIHSDSGYETMRQPQYESSNQDNEASAKAHELSKYGTFDNTYGHLASQVPSEKYASSYQYVF